MADRMSRPSVAVLVLILAAAGLAACSSGGHKLVELGTPAGFTAYTLTGASLSAQTVTVNGLALDTSSAEAIDASAQAIVDSDSAPAVVTEVTGGASFYTVDFTADAPPVPPTFHGANLQWRSKFFLTSPLWKALVSHMKLDLLRFPGGQERVRYDGKDSLSGTVEGDTLTPAAGQPYEYRISGEDVANYIALCTEMGINAEPEVNITVPNAGMWRDMVTQIAGTGPGELGYDLRYISAGNEPDISAHAGNWGPEALDATTLDQALANYAARYQAYAAALRVVKPDLTFALGELGTWAPGQLGSNLDAVFAGALAGPAAAPPGAVSGHWYMLGDWGQPSTYADYPSIDHLVVTGNDIHNISYLSTIVSTLRDHAASGGLADPKIFIGEYGTSWSATAADAVMQDRLAAAIFNAETQEYAKTLGVDSMEWFGLSDPTSFYPWVPSLIAVEDAGGVSVRPQYYVYFFYKHLYGDRIVTVPGGQEPDVSVYASRDAAHNYLMLINRTDSGTIRVADVITAAWQKRLKLTLPPRSVSVVRF